MADRNLEIVEWLEDGHHSLADDAPTVGDLITATGRLLDKNCSGDIVGPILFKGADGKYYTGNVEFVIEEIDADDDRVKEAIANKEDEDP